MKGRRRGGRKERRRGERGGGEEDKGRSKERRRERLHREGEQATRKYEVRGERGEQSRYCDLVATELNLEATNGEEDVLLGQLEACALQCLEVRLIVILSEAGDLPCA